MENNNKDSYEVPKGIRTVSHSKFELTKEEKALSIKMIDSLIKKGKEAQKGESREK